MSRISVSGRLASVVFSAAASCALIALFVPSAGAAGCPNEVVRLGPSALLPACRAYEMVSPIDKNGGSVAPGVMVKTSDAGDAVSFYSTAVFAGGQASPLASGYVSLRSGGAWATKGVEGPQLNEYGFFEYASPAISDDATKTLQASRLALAPGAIEGGSNLYVRDNATGAYRLVAAQPGAAFWEFDVGYAKGVYAGGTASWSNMLLAAPFKLTPDATEFGAESKQNLYEFTGGRLRLADVLPKGEPAPEGARPLEYGHSVSADGSRVVFLAGPSQTGPLYVRIDGNLTVAVSASQRPADKGAVASVTPFFADADDSQIFFSSGQNLLPGEETKGSETIYRYDVDSGTLTDEIPKKPAEGAKVRGLIAAGEDGSLFFRSDAALAPGGKEVTNEADDIYALRNGRVEFVGLNEDVSPGAGSASANGRYFAFETSTPLRPSEDLPSPACGASERCRDVYVFDTDTEELRCASCASGPDAGNSTLGNEARAPSGPKRVTSVLDDGTVFIETPNALSPRDVNGVADVYAWQGGASRLVSTGTGSQPSKFANATPDGSSVFFITSQPLVPQDRDDSLDVYADRELGGLASQFPSSGIPPCSSESCRPASPAAPPRNLAGSAAAGEGPCAALAAGARRSGAAALRLSGEAKRARESGANEWAKSLRRRAKTESGRAKALRKRTGACRRAGR